MHYRLLSSTNSKYVTQINRNVSGSNIKENNKAQNLILLVFFYNLSSFIFHALQCLHSTLSLLFLLSFHPILTTSTTELSNIPPTSWFLNFYLNFHYIYLLLSHSFTITTLLYELTDQKASKFTIFATLVRIHYPKDKDLWISLLLRL